MFSKRYVLNHDFGYGKENQKEEINKLNLRNINDLKYYIKDFISNVFDASVKGFIVCFNDGIKAKIVITKC